MRDVGLYDDVYYYIRWRLKLEGFVLERPGEGNFRADDERETLVCIRKTATRHKRG